MGIFLRGPIVLALALGIGACAGARAEVPVELPVELPDLHVPPAPSRVIAPLPQPVAEAPVPAEPVEAPAAVRPPPSPRPVAASEPALRTDEVTPAAVEAGLELRMPQGGDDEQVERQIRERLGRAGAMLRQVNVTGLRADARAQYDTARRFQDQGEEALRARNYVFASYLADKAETMARELVRR